ncbi:MAG: hypothetical protein JXB50_02025 [Spirochaetes bacterium]|nr:hypothetical protein [Spirochaetota bacterium]
MSTHEKELYNHFLNVLKLPKEVASYRTRQIIEMELNLDRMNERMLVKR